MSTLLDGTGTWRDAAVGVLLFVGALASVAGVLGRTDAMLSDGLLRLGALALVVFGASAGRSALARFGVVNTVGDPPDPDLSPATDPPADRDALPALELYQAESCPHCREVRRFCTRNGVSVVLHNPRTAGSPLGGGTVTDDGRHDDLVAHGEDQVPLLVDHDRGVALYESDEIVAYLDEQYA